MAPLIPLFSIVCCLTGTAAPLKTTERVSTNQIRDWQRNIENFAQSPVVDHSVLKPLVPVLPYLDDPAMANDLEPLRETIRTAGLSIGSAVEDPKFRSLPHQKQEAAVMKLAAFIQLAESIAHSRRDGKFEPLMRLSSIPDMPDVRIMRDHRLRGMATYRTLEAMSEHTIEGNPFEYYAGGHSDLNEYFKGLATFANLVQDRVHSEVFSIPLAAEPGDAPNVIRTHLNKSLRADGNPVYELKTAYRGRAAKGGWPLRHAFDFAPENYRPEVIEVRRGIPEKPLFYSIAAAKAEAQRLYEAEKEYRYARQDQLCWELTSFSLRAVRDLAELYYFNIAPRSVRRIKS